MSRRKIRMGLFLLGLFLATATDLHSGVEEKCNSPLTDHCCVTCCPARHLGPANFLIFNHPSLFPGMKKSWEELADTSALVTSSIFHPPKSASLVPQRLDPI
jgi:hypothetical protein